MAEVRETRFIGTERPPRDPNYRDLGGHSCSARTRSSNDEWDAYYCTELKGHAGPHIARYSDGRACCPAWRTGDPLPNEVD